MQKFANGDRVKWQEGGEARTGVVTASDVDGPADAGDKASMRFHRVTESDGSNHVLPEGDLEPAD